MKKFAFAYQVSSGLISFFELQYDISIANCLAIVASIFRSADRAAAGVRHGLFVPVRASQCNRANAHLAGA
jgi:hypothetical protein